MQAGQIGAENGPTVVIDGYNFNTKPPLNAVLLADGAAPQDVTASLSYSSYYLLVLNFGANGIPIDSFHPTRKQMVQIQWQNKVLAEVPIVIELPKCNVQLAGAQLDYTNTLAPQAGPDTNFGDSDVLTQVGVTPHFDATHAWADLGMGVWEMGGDGS